MKRTFQEAAEDTLRLVIGFSVALISVLAVVVLIQMIVAGCK